MSYENNRRRHLLKPHLLISSDIQHNTRWLLTDVIRGKKMHAHMRRSYLFCCGPMQNHVTHILRNITYKITKRFSYLSFILRKKK